MLSAARARSRLSPATTDYRHRDGVPMAHGRMAAGSPPSPPKAEERRLTPDRVPGHMARRYKVNGPYSTSAARSTVSGAGRSTVLSTVMCLLCAAESSTACMTSRTW